MEQEAENLTENEATDDLVTWRKWVILAGVLLCACLIIPAIIAIRKE